MPSTPPEKLRMQLSSDGRRVQLWVEPRIEIALNSADIQTRLKEMGCGDWVVLQDIVTKLPTLFQTIKESTLFDIAEKRDAEATLTVSRDELTAYLTLVPPCGGVPVTMQKIHALLAQHKVTHGLLQEAITLALATQTADHMLVAQASLPIHGDDARFESQLPQIIDRYAKKHPHESVNIHELSTLVTVKPNTPLLRKIPAITGTPGTTVTGKIIPAKSGRDLLFTASLSGVKFDANDPNLLLAAIGGQAVMIEHGMRVEPIIELKSVDVSSGNIDFDGTVNVSGDVGTGLRISAGVDIFVAGTVEGATLEAGGNIKVNKGVIGRGELHNDDGTPGARLARLKAHGSVRARFVENAIIEARGDVIIDELLAHCEITTQGAVVVGKDKAKKGHILGGSINAAHGIKAQVIGSAAGIRTTLEAGISRMLRQSIDAARDTIIVKCAERDKLTALLKHAAQLHEEAVLRARGTLANTEDEIKQLNIQRDALQKRLEQDVHARIDIGLRAHEGTTVLLGENVMAVDHEHGPGTFTLRDGEIVFTPH